MSSYDFTHGTSNCSPTEATLPRLDDVLQHHAGLLDAERGRGLVEDEHLRAEVHRPRDRHALPLAAGEGADRLVDVAQVDAHVEQFVLAGLLHEAGWCA
jgi:hypothetical protein